METLGGKGLTYSLEANFTKKTIFTEVCNV